MKTERRGIKKSNWVLILGGGPNSPIYCSREFRGKKTRIRKAKVIQVGPKILVAAPGQWWEASRSGKFWRLYHCYGLPRLTKIGRIPAGCVIWAKSLSTNTIETYEDMPDGKARATNWVIVREIRRCEVCNIQVPVELYDANGRPQKPPKTTWCPRCDEKLERVQKTRGNMALQSAAKAHKRVLRERQLRSHNLRWVREYSAQGNFTRREFKELCESYGGICLRCRKRRRLQRDHVIPLKAGGTNTIDNIQPLCSRCNSVKGATIKDYRKRFRPKPVKVDSSG